MTDEDGFGVEIGLRRLALAHADEIIQILEIDGLAAGSGG